MSEPLAVGIDLGTTYSALAHLNPSGRPEIVANRDGERVTASAVFFQKNGPVLVGQLAADAAEGFPDRVKRWVKRDMGDPAAEPFTVDGQAHSPEAISALILRKVKQDAEALHGTIDRAVITVPAYFDEPRRKATMDAGRLAGLDVLRIVNEPTAAALAYATGGYVTGRILVYDFGGGTFDVSIVDVVSDREVEVVATAGDHRLGGHDLDLAVAQHLSELFAERFGVPLMDDDPAARFRVLRDAERAKRALSTMQEVPSIPLLRGSDQMSASLDRATFDRLIAPYLARTRALITEVLDDAGIGPEGIDHVITVGGSTRVPAVKGLIEKVFGSAPMQNISPDEAVALGAAVQAGIVLEDAGQRKGSGAPAPKLRDVTAWAFGTLSVDTSHGVRSVRNSVIIPRNTSIPTSREQSFWTEAAGQTEINCTITQGDDPDPEFVNVIAGGMMELPPGRPSDQEIRVVYSYDANGRMSCEFLDVASGRKKVFSLDAAGSGGASGGTSSGVAIDVDFDDLDVV